MAFEGAIRLGNLGEQHIRKMRESAGIPPVLLFLKPEKRAKSRGGEKRGIKDIIKSPRR
jgi:hypothetical protein